MESGMILSANSLPVEVKQYVVEALSSNTKRAYRTDLEHFIAWGGSVPALPDVVAQYLTDHASTLSMATLSRRLVSVSKAHTVQGYADPVKSYLVKLTMRGIRRVHGRPQDQVLPILKEDLIVMLAHIPQTTKGIRDRALLLLGFCAALRRSELSSVRVEDLSFVSQGLVLTLPRSKTDQTGQGRKIAIPYGRGKICPVLAVKDWITCLAADKGPLFVPVTKGGFPGKDKVSDRAVAEIIKRYAHRSGFDPALYSGHSLRSGLATSAAQHGVSSWKIRQQTGHKSEQMLARYIRDGDLFIGNAAAIF